MPKLRDRALTIGLLASLSLEVWAADPASFSFEPAPCAFKGVDARWPKQNDIECGWLHVPESRGKPTTRRLKLWVAIARAESSAKQVDPILYIHGGPGIATVDYFFPYFPRSETWPAFRKTRDIVFFDQRGTGRSDPAFCPELDRTLDALDKQAPPPREALTRSLSAFGECRKKMLAAGLDFAAYNSTATVEDAEDLRRALGIAQWNIYGISYGTRVGMEYLRQHPRSVRSAILDSVFPPNSPNGAEQYGTTAKAYQALQRACDSDPACGKRFPDILSQLATATQRLDAEPLTRKGGRINGASLRSALWQMLVSSASATWVPLTIEYAAAGNEAIIRQVVEEFGGTSGFGDYNQGQAMAVNCYEAMVGNTAPMRREMRKRYPQLVGEDEVPEETDELCAAWQTERAPMAHFAQVHSTVPVLLYGGEFDPATPFDDACWPAGTCQAVRWFSFAVVPTPGSTKTTARAASPTDFLRHRARHPIWPASHNGPRPVFRRKVSTSS